MCLQKVPWHLAMEKIHYVPTIDSKHQPIKILKLINQNLIIFGRTHLITWIPISQSYSTKRLQLKKLTKIYVIDFFSLILHTKIYGEE